MESVKKTVAHNLHELRKLNNMTQAELAAKLNYSDKSISKWENGESMPDIETLCELAEMYGVTLDYLTHEGSAEDKIQFTKKNKDTENKITITALLITAVWFIAATIFVCINLNSHIVAWMCFVWAVPSSLLVMCFSMRRWGHRKHSAIVNSFLLWTTLSCICIQFIQYNVWPVLIVGVPIQVAIILFTKIKR